VTLTRQVDQALADSANQIIRVARVGALGVEAPNWDLFQGTYVQMWGREGQLLMESLNIRGYNQPLDPAGLRVGSPVYHNVPRENTRLRVLTIPLVVKDTDRVVATLQVGTNMDTVDAAQEVLMWILFIGTAISMAIAGLGGWFSTHQALAPLDSVTQTALQITRADDLSRRIPYTGPADDEVGQLIHAFNQTLSRLENLFNTQRRFIADVGHELRTPLTVIKGNIGLMRRMDCSDDESIGSIDTEVDRLTRLVGDLLLLAQAESGKLPLAYAIVELDTLVLDVLNQMRVLAKDRLRLKLGEIDQVLVCGDQDRLKQVLVNLIGNAIKYTPEGGEIVVGLAKEEERARITVSDDGPGIPVEDLPHIFERFYRGEKSRTRSRDGKGFGLGLSIAYWIVRNHGGHIDVSSSAEQGTTFCVWLPLDKAPCLESN
jgi:signal transduction histidine kinase